MESCILILSILFFHSCLSGKKNVISSPDKKIKVYFHTTPEKNIFYSIKYSHTSILQKSKLGITREDADFSKNLVLESVSPIETVKDKYTMMVGKKRPCSYTANRRVFHLAGETGEKMDIIFQVSNDSVAFRYKFPGKSGDIRKITKETSSFLFYPDTTTYIQRIADARSGWRGTNPSFEEYYLQGIDVRELGISFAGWMFPALFNYKKYWMLLHETAPDRNYCGCRLQQDRESREFYIEFPQKRENFPGGALYPESTLPWATPWRIITLGKGLKNIVESTAGTDLADHSKIKDTSFVKPGRASWSWALLKDYATVYKVQKRFIDYASDMGWEYCLVDAEWDWKIGYEKLSELTDYAKEKGVGILVWYNSAGSWNRTHQTPRNRLLTHEDRINEFSLLHEMGVKGIKADFFGGDGQSMMAYYQDIFEDAADFHLMVNVHGATIPRGWQRTYPNLLTAEAVRGFEYVTFDQLSADNQPNHSCMLPFTRNVFDPMDFTPVCFSEVPSIKRVTTNGFELALSVLFVSGIQHFVEVPEGMAAVPDYVQQFLREVPATWDDIRYIDGFPGKFVVIARRFRSTWYVAGINGENSEKVLELLFSFLKERKTCILIRDGEDNRTFARQEITVQPGNKLHIHLPANGGFVMKVDD